MLDFMHSKDDAINVLKKDHDKVKDLFDQFEQSDNRREKKSIAAEAIKELKVHTIIEEEMFYPEVRRQQEVEDYLMNEATEEHHVAKLLIAELDQMNGTEDNFDAKFHVLAENIRHHIRMEESEIMPEARNTDIDFEALGQELLNRKQELMQEGTPASAEERMVSGYWKKPNNAAQNKRKQPAMAGGRKSGRASYSSQSRSSANRNVAKRKKR